MRATAAVTKEAIQELREVGLAKSAIGYTDRQRRAFVRDYSTSSVFSDDVWVIDRKEMEMNYPTATRRLRFDSVPSAMRDDIKDWVLDQLMAGRKLKGLKSALAAIRNSLAVIPDKPVQDIDEKNILAIHDYLFDGRRSDATAASRWNILHNFFENTGRTFQAGVMASYVTPATRRKKCADKYIPVAAATKMDLIFMDDHTIPLPYRCIYWCVRLCPSRIEEVVSIRVDALKQVAEDAWILSIPVSKTAGNFEEPEEKV